MILSFILGGIVFGSIGVYAATQYNAAQIQYKNTTLDVALDDLYTKATTYKNLTNTTTATAADIASGKTAYKSDGTLLTGTMSNNASGTGVVPSTGIIEINNLGFRPEHVYVYFETSNTIDIFACHSTNCYGFALSGSKSSYMNQTSKYTLLDNGFKFTQCGAGITYHWTAFN